MIELEEVPPPKKAPIDQIAETMGLVNGLKVERNQFNPFRCASCGSFIKKGEWTVLVPYGVRYGDDAKDVEEAARLSAFNGHFTSWCLSCAPKKPRLERIKSGQIKWWEVWK